MAGGEDPPPHSLLCACFGAAEAEPGPGRPSVRLVPRRRAVATAGLGRVSRDVPTLEPRVPQLHRPGPGKMEGDWWAAGVTNVLPVQGLGLRGRAQLPRGLSRVVTLPQRATEPQGVSHCTLQAQPQRSQHTEGRAESRRTDTSQTWSFLT